MVAYFAQRYFTAFALSVAVPVVALAGPPFATDDPEPTKPGHFEVYIYSQGNWGGETQDGTALGVEVNYGLMEDVQVSGALPIGFNALDDRGTRLGLGDAEFGVKYRFIHEDEDRWVPQVSFYPSIEAPLVRSGVTGDRTTHVFLPLWAQKSFGAWTTFGGGGYRINSGSDSRDTWFVGWALLKHVDDKLALGGEIYHESAQERGVDGTLAGSLGAIYDFSQSWHLVGSVGIGTGDSGGSTGVSTYLALEWAD